MQYPTILAGDRITASLLTSMETVTVVKSADETRTNTNVASNDTELFFAVEANAIYVWEGFMKYAGFATAGGGASGDFQVDFTAPVGSTGEWGGFGVGTTVIGSTNVAALQIDTVNSQGYMLRVESNDVEQARTFGSLGTGTPQNVLMNGTLRTGSTAGTFQFQWAQGTVNATATTLFTDSWMKLTRVA